MHQDDYLPNFMPIEGTIYQTSFISNSALHKTFYSPVRSQRHTFHEGLQPSSNEGKQTAFILRFFFFFHKK